MVASHHRHHAVREYLEGLQWDGTPRLDTWLEMYLRARVDAAALDDGLSVDELNREGLERIGALSDEAFSSPVLLCTRARVRRPTGKFGSRTATRKW